MVTLLPEDIIFYEILSRFPVKFLIRLTLVCKRWLSLITAPGSPIQSHLSLTSLNLHHSNSFLLNDTTVNYRNQIIPLHTNHQSLRISSDNLLVIAPGNSVDVVGSVNGLVCFRHINAPLVFVILNPVTNYFKTIHKPLPSPSNALSEKIVETRSLFCHDPVNNDYKIIVFESYDLISEKGRILLKVQVYSCNSDNWKEIRDNTLPAAPFFNLFNGWSRPFPYLMFTLKLGDVLVVFDVHNEVFRRLPHPHYFLEDTCFCSRHINWMGSLGVLVHYKQYDDAVYTMDEISATWVKTYVVPDCLRPYKLLLSLSNGNLLVEKDGNLFLFEADQRQIKNVIVGHGKDTYDVVEYTESLVCIKGMQHQTDGECRGFEFPVCR